MPRWKPEEKWKDQDVFIIGGGSSLKDFDWSLLKDERTIGCNAACFLGTDVCKICIFGDYQWFREYKDKLERYKDDKGIIFTNCKQFERSHIDWVWWLPRLPHGLGTDALGWNYSTGAAAVNLALILGAKRIFLLGFDMHLCNGKPNWHDKGLDKPNSKLYERFVLGFTKVSIDLRRKFPSRQVVNVTDDSHLDVFTKVSCEEFWSKRKLERVNL